MTFTLFALMINCFLLMLLSSFIQEHEWKRLIKRNTFKKIAGGKNLLSPATFIIVSMFSFCYEITLNPVLRI